MDVAFFSLSYCHLAPEAEIVAGKYTADLENKNPKILSRRPRREATLRAPMGDYKEEGV